MQTKFINFMNSFNERFDTPKNSKLVKISSLKIFVQKAISLSILDGFQRVRAEN